MNNPAAQPAVDFDTTCSNIMGKPFILYLKLVIINKLMAQSDVKESEITLAIYVLGISLLNELDKVFKTDHISIVLILIIFLIFRTPLTYKIMLIVVHIIVFYFLKFLNKKLE